MAENLWVNIAYSKQDDGNIACKFTSNISFYREKEAAFDMKVYAAGYRVQSVFHHLYTPLQW